MVGLIAFSPSTTRTTLLPNRITTMEGLNSNEIVRRQLEDNSPDLIQLCIGHSFHLYLPSDWERDGTMIGRNTHIQDLRILDVGHASVPKENIEQFFRGLAANRSIKMLAFHRCDLYDGEIFSLLVPFFENNPKFECLEVNFGFVGVYGYQLGPGCLLSLALAISKFRSLKIFKLGCFQGSIDVPTEIFEALAGHSNMRKLILHDIYLNGPQTGDNRCGPMVHLLQCSCARSMLTALNLCFGTKIDNKEAIASLSNLLQNPRSTLTVLNLSGTNLGDKEASDLALGLAGNSTLKELGLSCMRDTTEIGWHAIFLALQSPACMLEALSLQCSTFNDNVALSLARVLVDTSTLKSLDLSKINGHQFTKNQISFLSWQAIFECLHSPGCKLEDLKLSRNKINDYVMSSLASSLAMNTRLKELDLGCNEDVTATGWNAFWPVLQNETSALEKLDLSSNSIYDEEITSLTNALLGNTKLKELDLSSHDVTATGWEYFFAVLQSPDSSLERLYLASSSSFNNGTMIALAKALAHNNTLRELLICYADDDGDTSNGWAALSRVLCDDSSIMATYNSNHTLENLYEEEFSEEEMPKDIKSLICINQENNKGQAARVKIIETHFSGKRIDIQPFLGMGLEILPHAIAWALNGSDNDAEGKGLNLAYHILTRVLAPELEEM